MLMLLMAVPLLVSDIQCACGDIYSDAPAEHWFTLGPGRLRDFVDAHGRLNVPKARETGCLFLRERVSLRHLKPETPYCPTDQPGES